MKERPILFSGPMVRAILEGRKTQTRRVVKDTKKVAILGTAYEACGVLWDECPYGSVGDRLWVKETWSDTRLEDSHNRISYKATWRDELSPECGWRPSIYMPRWASRITLEITGVRVERLQEISEEDARKEGVYGVGCLSCGVPEPCGCRDPRPDARDAFAYIWQSIHGPVSWSANPWVWVIEFRRIKP